VKSRLLKTISTFFVAGALMFSAAACTSSTATQGSTEPSTAASQATSYAAVIDVRTPEEFRQGHVLGAINYNMEAPAFAEQIASLDAGAGSYLIYCRSGNRSAVAAQQMREIGLQVVDGGGLSDMENAGWDFS